MDIVVSTPPSRCAFCHDQLGQGRTCEHCGTSLHAVCWREAGHCPTIGCRDYRPPSPQRTQRTQRTQREQGAQGRPQVPPAQTARRPRSSWWPLLVALGVVAAIFVVAVNTFRGTLSGAYGPSSERMFEASVDPSLPRTDPNRPFARDLPLRPWTSAQQPVLRPPSRTHLVALSELREEVEAAELDGVMAQARTGDAGVAALRASLARHEQVLTRLRALDSERVHWPMPRGRPDQLLDTIRAGLTRLEREEWTRRPARTKGADLDLVDLLQRGGLRPGAGPEAVRREIGVAPRSATTGAGWASASKA